MSASLNTVSGTLYEDFVAPLYKTQSDAQASMLMKLIVLLVGGCCVLLIFVVERLGDLMQMAMSLTSITHAPMIYIFSVGLFFPWINSHGAIWGAISSLASMGVVVGGSQLYILMGKLKFPGKITTVDQCPLDTVINNSTMAYLSSYVGPSSPVAADPSVPQLFQVSYMYYCTVGVLVGVVVGFMVSHLTGGQPLETLDRRTITPCMRGFLPQEKQRPRPEELKLLNGKSKATIVSGVNRV